MASSVAIAHFAKRICRIDYPLFLPGASLKSTAGDGGLGKAIGRLSDQPHLPKNCESRWTDIVPRFYSGQTIWAEASIEALLSCGREDLLPEFNAPKLYAWLLMFRRRFWRISLRTYGSAMHRTKRGSVAGVAALAVCLWQLAWLRVQCFSRRYVKQKPSVQPAKLQNIKDIQGAVPVLQDYLRGRGWVFDEKGLTH